MKQGDIYYSTDLNLYYVIINVNFRGEGYMIYKDFKSHDKLVKVGGIY